MGLSRLDNFLKNARGNILYVNPNDLDSTDSIENQGNSLTRPFKTIQRALIEAARFSYQKGLDNDRFGKTTILLYPGDHVVDNRPGWIPTTTANQYLLRSGETSTDFSPWGLTTNFDLTTSDNVLYKLNSVRGGVILPRGTSIVGLDLRKTKIRPKYIPNPENDNIERSAVFRLTGACYLWQFSIFDGDPNGNVYKDYTTNLFVPNFSHHKLTCFEYADGVNPVNISDSFNTFTSDRTDLDMYYEKVGLVYGPSSGREIEPDYPSSGIDIQTKIDEYRIVGPTGGSVGITSIKSGDGTTLGATKTITVDLVNPLPGLDVDTAFQVNNVGDAGYNGSFVVSDVLSTTRIKYNVSVIPTNPLPDVTSAILNLQVDSVGSASPYIFNISLRSVYGMCGVLADGDKAGGFKSMVIAQFTGIGLQKDNNAFVKYDSSSGAYLDSTSPQNANINSDSLAVFKPTYRNFHIKTINDAYIQNVSVFAIGYAEHFSTENGGDQSINNSNSNFGAKSLVASGFKRNAFPRDDVGYITHIIPPKQLEAEETGIEFSAIDVYQTVVGVASTSRLYLYNQTNRDTVPDSVIEGYRIGARNNDTLNVLISQSGVANQYSARIVMPNTELGSEKLSYQKDYEVARVGTSNSISSNTLTLSKPHSFLSGESIRIIAENGHLPDGLENNKIYYAITSGIGTNQVKIAQTLKDAISSPTKAVDINSKGGILHIQSRVSDKVSGDIGHPIQYDNTKSQWYITVGTAATDNTIYSNLVGLGTTALGAATPRTYINRKPDTRSIVDTTYRLRYVIPAGTGITSARPPIDGYIIQESSSTTGASDTEIQTYYSTSTVSLSNVNQQRNFKFIANARWSANTAYILSELPHNLSVGAEVELKNIISTNNPVGTANSGFNGTYTITGITSSKEFVVSIPSSSGPGSFANNTSARNTSLPYFAQKKYPGTYHIYKTEEIQQYIPGAKDGIYHLLLINSSNSPSVSPFSTERYSQPIQYLYPQTNRDNPNSDPNSAKSFAVPSPIGQVVVNNPQNSLTRETIEKSILDFGIGIGITAITSNTAGTAHTIFTSIDHGLNRLVNVSIANSGAGYGVGSGTTAYFYNAKLVGSGTTTGQSATARVRVDASGFINEVKIMDGGSAYKVGDYLNVVGIATTTGYSVGIVTVTQIYSNIGETIAISGIIPESNSEFNNLYRITGIGTANTKQIEVASSVAIGAATSLGIGVTNSAASSFVVNGQTLNVSGLSYNPTTGIAIVTTSQAHGLSVDNKIKLGGADNSIYNGDFIVKQNLGLNSFSVKIGIGTSTPATTGTIYAYRYEFASAGGNITPDNENLSGRMATQYAGITTTLDADILTTSASTISITNLNNLDIKIGDYLVIDEEIVRVSQTVVAGTSISVFRGILGTRPTIHAVGAVVKRISCHPIEFRRHSIIRASGHTFEYLGYGPGNYSTAFPDRQNRNLSAQEVYLAQSTKKDGGINVYTGMNDKGDFYVGNKRVSSSTGEDEVFDSPIPSVVGEDITFGGSNIGFNVLTPLEVSVNRSLRVEGGTDGNLISQFDGPVVFNNKITSNSTKGIEAYSLFLQGDATVSRKYTVGISTPALAGNPGDISFFSDPVKGGHLGWVYTSDNGWYRFGNVSISKDSNIQFFDKIGIATSFLGDSTLRVGAASSLFAVDGTGVGIGTTANKFKLNVNGNTNLGGNVNVVGVVTAASFTGDGSGLSNLANDSLWTSVASGLGTGVYPNDLMRVGIGTTVPRYNLELGAPGTGRTDLYVNNKTILAGFTTTVDLTVGGTLTATSYRLDSSTSNIRAGIVTATTLVVGTAVSTSGSNVGFGTASPRAKVDIEGSVRFKTYSENVENVTSSGNIVTVDLSLGQTFELTVNEPVVQFRLLNSPSNSTAFTIKIAQNSTGYSVGIDTFKTLGGSAIPVYWSGGGVIPTVTTTANAIDIYSFKTFDGGATLYGVVGGQNFS